MVKLVIDSSVVIDYTRAGLGPLEKILGLSRAGKAKVYIPTSVIFELWAGNSMSDSKTEKDLVRLLKSLVVFDLTIQIAKKSGELIRNRRLDDFVDASVVATALELDARLATANKKHFAKIKGLKLFD